MRDVKVWGAGRDRLGEGPVWDARLGELLWVDIDAGAVNRLDPATGEQSRVLLPEKTGWIIPRRDHPDHIVGLASGIAFFDLSTGVLTGIVDPEPERPGNRLNDGKVDQWGRIWTGSKSESDEPGAGALYRLDDDLTCRRMDDGYCVTNGPAFSLDGSTMLHTDSAARTVFAYDLAADGTLGNRRVWLRFPDEWGYPDGMTTDAEGCIWIAHWDGWRISRFSPEGQLIRSIALPARNITSCAFGGPGLDRLFITSSTIGCEEDEHAGALFEVDPQVAGVAQMRFAG